MCSCPLRLIRPLTGLQFSFATTLVIPQSSVVARSGFQSGCGTTRLKRGDLILRADQVAGRHHGDTRQRVAELLEDGLRPAEIARRLAVSPSTVCFHMRKLGIPAREALGRRFDWHAIRVYYEAGHSAAECRAQFGFGRNAWADAVARGAIQTRPRLEPLEDVLAAGRRRSRHHVKLRLVLAGLKKERCEVCGIDRWLDKPLPLELHHVNGDGLDNRIENLMLLCPNCHSQTSTWGGRKNAGRRSAA